MRESASVSCCSSTRKRKIHIDPENQMKFVIVSKSAYNRPITSNSRVSKLVDVICKLLILFLFKNLFFRLISILYIAHGSKCT